MTKISGEREHKGTQRTRIPATWGSSARAATSHKDLLLMQPHGSMNLRHHAPVKFAFVLYFLKLMVYLAVLKISTAKNQTVCKS